MNLRKNVFTVYIEQDEDDVFVGSIPSIPGCHAEGDTIEQMMTNLKDVLRLCLRNQKIDRLEKFVGIQNLEIAHA